MKDWTNAELLYKNHFLCQEVSKNSVTRKIPFDRHISLHPNLQYIDPKASYFTSGMGNRAQFQ